MKEKNANKELNDSNIEIGSLNKIKEKLFFVYSHMLSQINIFAISFTFNYALWYFQIISIICRFHV